MDVHKRKVTLISNSFFSFPESIPSCDHLNAHNLWHVAQERCQLKSQTYLLLAWQTANGLIKEFQAKRVQDTVSLQMKHFCLNSPGVVWCMDLHYRQEITTDLSRNEENNCTSTWFLVNVRTSSFRPHFPAPQRERFKCYLFRCLSRGIVPVSRSEWTTFRKLSDRHCTDSGRGFLWRWVTL